MRRGSTESSWEHLVAICLTWASLLVWKKINGTWYVFDVEFHE